MPRPSVIPQVKERLETYLNECEAAYLQQPEGMRQPTLPSTPDGKINVRAVAQAIDLKTTQEKYLYERVELSQLVNLVAEGQGLLPIGARLLQSAGDSAIKERMVRQAQDAREASQSATEALAVQAELLQKLQEASHAIEVLNAENLRLRAQLDAVFNGVLLRVEP
ncbi:hypothetical protein GTP23_17135 [Pseudoduganella sp. FT93W]|uniref:Uncharacterized protein n=1 Tax=Duganella fentianensis TaxID=2692177 RepID=A0A845I0K6_9BURK|nr:hypothetical protein [Duganella fentianensis]MYN46769.1 hypothetical protein [Duganella fentianensis]